MFKILSTYNKKFLSVEKYVSINKFIALLLKIIILRARNKRKFTMK